MERAGCDEAEEITLSRDFYRGDRSMRESGFDVSFRFGPHGAATHHYAAVCLNSLLFKYEKDLEEISTTLGDGKNSGEWKKRAEQRRESLQKYLWDAHTGLFFYYNITRQHRS